MTLGLGVPLIDRLAVAVPEDRDRCPNLNLEGLGDGDKPLGAVLQDDGGYRTEDGLGYAAVLLDGEFINALRKPCET